VLAIDALVTAQVVDRAILRGLHEPRGGVLRNTCLGPLLERRHQRVLCQLLRETDVVKGIRSEYQYGFSNSDEAENYFFKSGRGLSHELVEAISEHKNEPDWMRKFRHKSLDYFLARPLPTWGGHVAEIDFDNIYYYIKPTEKQASKWEDLPADILDTWDKLGIPEAEKK
jgi:Fe-S cluster assembly protein SufB